jgi:hypothetical protein
MGYNNYSSDKKCKPAKNASVKKINRQNIKDTDIKEQPNSTKTETRHP